MLNIREEDIDRVTEAFYLLLDGRRPSLIELAKDHPDDELKQLVDYVNRYIAQHNEFADILRLLSRGDLDFVPPKGRQQVLQSFKNLHANLRHLTWKTQQVAGGDLDQRVDFMGDFSTAFNSMTQQLKDAFEKIEAQNKELAEAYNTIRLEKEKSDRLLLNILPGRVADDLKQKGTTTPELFENTTVLFSDLVGFTSKSSQLDPETLISELNEIFTAFDNIVEENRCERIKTIGDAYLAVCGMPAQNPRHAENIMNSAQQMVQYLSGRNAKSRLKWEIRVGVHSGNVVGGVVGVKKYIYDIFGDTINTASRMESNSAPMRVNVSEATYALVKGKFNFVERETCDVKGKGRMRMYFLLEPGSRT